MIEKLIPVETLKEKSRKILSNPYTIISIQTVIDDISATDSIEVVHCGSCLFAQNETADGWVWCNVWCNGTRCGGYCHKGKRKDNA